MSKAKKPTKQAAKCNEPRFVCDNWDTEVKVRFSCDRPSLKRKVVTRGMWTIDAADIIAEAKKHLRMGQQVYIGRDILLSPVMDTDLKTMYVSARTVGDFRECLADKTATVKYRGEELDDDGREEIVGEAVRRHKEHLEQQITPDTMVTCPECGTRFRVGQKICNNN